MVVILNKPLQTMIKIYWSIWSTIDEPVCIPQRRYAKSIQLCHHSSLQKEALRIATLNHSSEGSQHLLTLAVPHSFVPNSRAIFRSAKSLNQPVSRPINQRISNYKKEDSNPKEKWMLLCWVEKKDRMWLTVVKKVSVRLFILKITLFQATALAIISLKSSQGSI